MFNIKKNGESKTCIIPYIDMINHSLQPDCKWEYSDEKEGFTLTAKKDLIPGE